MQCPMCREEKSALYISPAGNDVICSVCCAFEYQRISQEISNKLLCNYPGCRDIGVKPSPVNKGRMVCSKHHDKLAWELYVCYQEHDYDRQGPGETY
jgi:hypothetical protein